MPGRGFETAAVPITELELYKPNSFISDYQIMPSMPSIMKALQLRGYLPLASPEVVRMSMFG